MASAPGHASNEPTTMKDWYLRQSPRDRAIVVAVGVLCVAGLLYALLWYPVASRTDSARRAIDSKSETLAFVREGGARLVANGGAGAGAAQLSSDKAPYLLIDEVIREAGISPPERVEPAGGNGARVQFSEVEFDRLVGVIAELELYGLSVSNMTLTRRSPGTVSARFTMERG